VYYFADGSNMLTRRIQARVPSAKPVPTAKPAGHTLRFPSKAVTGLEGATWFRLPQRLPPSRVASTDIANINSFYRRQGTCRPTCSSEFGPWRLFHFCVYSHQLNP